MIPPVPRIALAIVAFATLAAAPQSELHLLYRRGGKVHRAASVAELNAARPFDYVWAWRDGRPPVRLAGSDEFDEEQLLARVRNVAAREVTLSLARESGARREPLTLVIAPGAMWREVPESELPRVAVDAKADAVRIVIAANGEPWRVRGFGKTSGSWWTSIAAARPAVTLRPATDVRLQLVDEREAPVIDGSLTITDASPRASQRSVTARYVASEKAWIVIPALPAGDEIVAIAADRESIPTAVTGRPSDLPQRIVLRTGGVVRGRIVDARDRPLAGVSVRCEAWSHDGPGAQLFSRSVVTDAEGRFRFERVPRNRLNIAFARPGYASSTLQSTITGATLDLGDVTLQRGRPARVRVVDDQSEPVARAALRYGNAAPVQTDARGFAEVSGLPEGDATLDVTGKGFIAAKCAVPLEEVAECRVTRSFRVTGRYLAAAANARVEIASGSRSRFEQVGDDGIFDLDLEPESSHELLFLSPAAAALRVKVRGAAGEERNLGELLPPMGAVVVGRVIDRAGAPVSGARIWSPRPAEGGMLMSWATGNVAETRSDAAGSFMISGLPEAATLLRVDAPGAARRFVPVQPAGDVPVDVGDVVVTAGGTVAVRFENRALRGVAVVTPSAQQLEFDALKAAIAGGEAIVRHVPPGPARVSVTNDAGVPLCDGEIAIREGETTELPCDDEPMTVAGEVWLDQRAAGGGTLQWTRASAAPAGAVIMTTRSRGGASTQQIFGRAGQPIAVPLDSSGRFQTDDLRPGTYDVVLVGEAGSVSSPQKVTIPAVTRFTTRITFRGGIVAGTVIDDKGAPVGGARVRELTSLAVALSNGDGRFELRGVAAGTARVQATLGKRASSIAEVPVGQPDSGDVTLRLSAVAEPLRIAVTTADGAAASGAFVFVDTGSSIDIVTCDSAGRAEFAFRSGAPPRIRLAVLFRDRWHFGAWRDVRSAEVVVRMTREAGALTLRAERQSAQPVIANSDGWVVTNLLSIVGAAAAVAPQQPLRVAGLPAGDYVVDVAGLRRTVPVRADHDADVALP